MNEKRKKQSFWKLGVFALQNIQIANIYRWLRRRTYEYTEYLANNLFFPFSAYDLSILQLIRIYVWY